MHVNKPTNRKGVWCVVISETNGLFAKEIEVIKFGSQESAYQGYRQIRKEQGKGL